MHITIYENQYRAAAKLPPEEREGFWMGVMAYAFDGADPAFEGICDVVWTMMAPAVEKSVQGQRNGAKGGRKSGEKPCGERVSEGVSEGVETPLGNPPAKPFSKRGETPLENQIENGNGIEGLGESLKDSLTLPDDRLEREGVGCAGGEGPAAPPPCPVCDAPMQPTSSFKPNSAQRLYRCPLCHEEAYA